MIPERICPTPIRHDPIPLDGKQIKQLNDMFGTIASYEDNMAALWRIGSFIYNELEKRGFPEGELNTMFHTLNNLVSALLPSKDLYYPTGGYQKR